jgi:ATP-dependent DNA helicase RecG
MTLDELKARLNQLEWCDVEFKEATFDIPKSAYPTVSAFSNTSGGWLVFGIQAKDGRFTIKGVVNADELQNGFIGTLRQKGKFSCAIAFKESKLHDGGNTVLVFYIPEVHRAHKPVHIDGRIDQSYVRKGGTTQQCNKDEIAAFMRDAASEHFEDRPVDTLDVATCFDPESLKWYRHFFGQRHPGHETEAKPDLAFLEHFGLVVPVAGTLRPTRAAILLFGTSAAMHRMLPRQVVDFFIFQCKQADKLPEQRWDDRIDSLAEGSILKAWQRIVAVYHDRFAEKRFELDATTMQRKGTPPDYLAFREAVLNLLIHQDYGDHTRKANITLFADEVQFWNPGASFVCGEDFFKPGDKPVRNTRLRSMLTRIGIGEQANTGIRNIFAHQRELGRLPPVLANDPADHSFAITLSKLRLVSQNQQLLLQKVGARLTEPQAAIFIHALRQGEVRPLEAQSVCGLSLKETTDALSHLVVQVLLEKHPDPAGEVFRPVPVFLETLAKAGGLPAPESTVPADTTRPPNLITPPTDQVPPAKPNLVMPDLVAAAAQLPSTAKAILRYCQAARGIPDILDAIGLKSRTMFKQKHLDGLLEAGWLRQTHPDQPFHPSQGYVLTDAGKALLPYLQADQVQPSSSEPSHSRTDQPLGPENAKKT